MLQPTAGAHLFAQSLNEQDFRGVCKVTRTSVKAVLPLRNAGNAS